MGRKLVRNKSDEQSRAFWDAVRVAAASAPRLKFREAKGGGEVVVHGRDGRIRDTDVVAPDREAHGPRSRKR